MRKEIVWASVIGITFGLVIAFGIWRINSSMNPGAAKTSQTPEPQIVTNEFKITLDKPSQNDVFTQDIVAVSGITKPHILMTISGPESDYILRTDESGVFNQEVNLIPGVNQLKLTAFDNTGSQSVEKVLVVYSSSFELNTLENETDQNQATENAEIRQRVQDKVQAALNKPKAYLGTVTDIADSTIQIKSDTGEIKQISTSTGEVVVVNATGSQNKTVKLLDVAIGDFIVAMGYVNGNSVLNVQRILITNNVTEPNINVFFGKISDKTTKSLIVTGFKDEEETEVIPDANTDIYYIEGEKTIKTKFANIEIGEITVYVSTQTNDKTSIRTIFTFPKDED
jgi:hypothetical protein